MNKKRREEIQKIRDIFEEKKEELECLKDEEQECYDNLPEPIQAGERGDTMQENIDNLDYAISNIEDAISNLDEVLEA
jgi:flagellar biosynthesis chaperone FliJ